MTVENKYVKTDTGARSANISGSNSIVKGVVSFEVSSDDDNGSVYRIPNIPSTAIMGNVEVANDAITGGNDYDVGFYDVEGGDAVDADALLDGGDLSSAHASGSELSAISAVDVANRGKQVYELLGKTQDNKASYYDLCVTANTVGTADGTVTIIFEYMI